MHRGHNEMIAVILVSNCNGFQPTWCTRSP